MADFGLARMLSGTSHTKTGMLIGTAAYLAPEQVSRGTADARTDVYAAGIMLFELLTGAAAAHRGHPAGGGLQARQRGGPGAVAARARHPAALDALVARATSRDPDLRPADAGQFLRAVSEVRRSLPPARPAAPAIPGTSLPVSADPARWPMPGDPAWRADARRRRSQVPPPGGYPSETQPPGPVPSRTPPAGITRRRSGRADLPAAPTAGATA